MALTMWTVAGISALIYVLIRILESILNVFGKNPLTWAERKAAEAVTPASTASAGVTTAGA
jgi:hypothetical protein